MTIICVNPKEYRLTLNKEYEVVNETNVLYQITNDNGVLMHYYKDLFIYNNKKKEMVKAPEVEEKKELTDKEILDSLDISETENDEFEISVKTNNGNKIFYPSFDYNQSDISCGITEIYSIQDVTLNLNQIFPGKTDLCAEIFKRILESTIECYIAGVFVILSTNTNYRNFDIIEKAVNLIGFENEVIGVNPNSGNEIVMWTIRI